MVKQPTKWKNSPSAKVCFIILGLACFFPWVNALISLIMGFSATILFGNPFHKINHTIINWALKVAVIGLGFGMNLQETLKVGQEGFWLTLSTIVITISLGLLLGRLLKINRKTSYLISGGTAICGGSAIAALSASINASENEISTSLGIVFLLNSIALIVFPVVGVYFGLSQYDFGMWSAIAIHDTSSVVGAAQTYGDQSLQIATTVKLSRALWIVPLTIFSMFIFKGKNRKMKIPWFIFIFIGVIVSCNYFPVNSNLTSSITDISKSLLTVTLFFVGAGISIKELRKTGWKPMFLGIILWVSVSVFTLMLVLYS